VEPAGGKTVRLTGTPRHHRGPVCSAADDAVWFLSPGTASSDWPDRELWRLNRRTGAEVMLASLPAGKTLDEEWSGRYPTFRRIVGGSDAGGVFVLADEKGSMVLYRVGRKLERVGPACYAAASPDGARIAYGACGGGDLVLAAASGKRITSLGACRNPSWSPDGSRLACTTDTEVRVFNGRTGARMSATPLAEHGKAECFAWSPDGKRYLCAAPGANTNSTSPYSDYSVFDLDTRAWRTLPEGGNGAVWADSTRIVYVTQRELTEMGTSVNQPAGKILRLDGTAGQIGPGRRKRGEWTAHLKSVTLPAMQVKALTSGLQLDRDPAVCGAVSPRIPPGTPR
jgi:Tol biopolymer transport system component